MHVSKIHVLAAFSIAAVSIAGCLFRGAEANRGADTARSPGSDTGAAPGSLSVDGIASLQVIPDVVDIRMTLWTEKPRPKAAMVELQDKQAKLLAALQTAGVAKSNITLSHTSLNPAYHTHPRNQEIRGYEASVTVVVELRAFDRIADIMETGAAVDVRRMSTSFRSTELPKLKKRVRELAFKAARDKAEQIATLMDIEVGRVIKVSEGQSGTGWRGSMVSNFNEFVAAPAHDRVMPGAQPLTLTVQVSYEI